MRHYPRTPVDHEDFMRSTRRKAHIVQYFENIWEVLYPKRRLRNGSLGKPSYVASLQLLGQNARGEDKFKCFIEQRTKPPKRPHVIGHFEGSFDEAVVFAVNAAFNTHTGYARSARRGH